MGILDGIVEWLATQVMNLLDLISTSVLGALGCDMNTFKRYFPAAETMYEIFVWIGVGLLLLNLIWCLFKNYGAGLDVGDRGPGQAAFTQRRVSALHLVRRRHRQPGTVHRRHALQLDRGQFLAAVQFGNFNSTLLVIISVIANGSVALIALILLIILAWNYLKLLLEAAERYITLGILVFLPRRWRLRWVPRAAPRTSSRAGAGCLPFSCSCSL